MRPLLAARARFRYLDPGPHPRSPRPRPIPLGSRFALDSAGSAFEPAARVCLAVQFSCVARLVGAVRIPVSRNVSRETSVRVGGGGAGWDPCRRAPCDGSFPCAWKRMLAMHDSSPSPFLPTWCFPPRLRRQAPIIVHSEHSLPPRFPAFCGRCRREPVRAERGGRRPLGWRPPPTGAPRLARLPRPPLGLARGFPILILGRRSVPARLVGRRASRSAGMFHVKHPFASFLQKTLLTWSPLEAL